MNDDTAPAPEQSLLAGSLPPYLATRYRGWHATDYAENKVWYHRLADHQSPRIMAIACCDSRVNINALFGAEAGEIFLHRNIANVVPPYLPDGDPHGTSAALEYGVTALNVAHLIVIGHSNCGGVRGCDQMCNGNAPELETKESFVGTWLNILKPGHARVSGIADEAERLRALEKESVVVSLENLLEFPFIRDAVQSEKLSLHGLWFDIGEGLLEQFVPEEKKFREV